MNKKILIIIIIFIFLSGGIWFSFSGRNVSTDKQSDVTKVEESNDDNADVSGGNNDVLDVTDKNDGNIKNESSGEVKMFTLDASNFQFSINEIRVKENDKVKITLTNSDGFHDWVLDEFNASTKRIQAGETDFVEFVANKKGTFEYYCSVGSHRKLGMAGKLIVE